MDDFTIRLTIEHKGTVFEPPIKGEVKIEWDRHGSPGKMTFTTIKVNSGGMSFTEGDKVVFYYNEKPLFVGYVFTKKRDKQHHIDVTCYDQLRYFKNKFSYGFTNKTATQIIKQLCDDFELNVGKLDDSKYVIPALFEENKEAWDIALSATEETLANNGNMFVLYDDAGEVTYKNCANMVSDIVITDTTAQNFDYSSSIDEETYNSVVLYYKPENAEGYVYEAVSDYDSTDSASNLMHNARAVYTFLHNLGVPDPMIAGCLGNWSAESGIDPTSVEGIYSEAHTYGPKKQAAMANPQNYVLNSLKPRTRISVNWNAYKGRDGLYYPGIGLGGFTGTNATDLIDFAKSIGKPWYSLDAQLQFCIASSFIARDGKSHGGYRPTFFTSDSNKAKYASLTPSQAAYNFFMDWEGMKSSQYYKLNGSIRSAKAEEWTTYFPSWR